MIQDQPLLSWVVPRVLGLIGYLALVFLVVRPVLGRAVAACSATEGCASPAWPPCSW